MDMKLLTGFVPINSLSSQNLRVLSEEAVVENLARGSRIFSQGDNDPSAYFLLQGEVMLVNSSTMRPRIITAGTESARYALAHLKPRIFSGIAKTDVTYAKVDASLIDRLLTFDQAASYEVAEIGGGEEAQWVYWFLRGETFKMLPPANISQLLAKFQPCPVKAGQVIIRQGEPGEYYYVIKQGEADVLRKSEKSLKVEIVAHIGEGDGFGEEALLSGKPRNATVVMTESGQLMRLNRLDFNELLRTPLVHWLSPEEVRAAVKSGSGLLDVRLPDEYLSGTIKGAVNLPLIELRERIHDLDHSRHYVVFCHSGSRSCAAAFLMIQRGLKVSVLRGGLDQLKSGAK